MSKVVSIVGLAAAAYFTGGAALGAAGAAGGAAAGASSFAGVAANMGAISGAAASSGGILSSIGTGLTLASAATTLFGGMQQANAASENANFQSKQLSLQAENEMIAARQEETKGKEASNAIFDNLIQVTAQQKLYYATGGIDPGFGTPASVDSATRKIANLQMSTARTDAQSIALSRRRNAAAMQLDRLNIKSQGASQVSNAYMSSVSSAGQSLADLYEKRRTRG